MNDFVRRLPWQLGALGGLLVGAISLAGEVDLWACLIRAGIAFLVFGVLGLGLRALLEAGMDHKPSARPSQRKHSQGHPAETGTHIDQKIPPITPSDLPPPDDRPPVDH